MNNLDVKITKYRSGRVTCIRVQVKRPLRMSFYPIISFLSNEMDPKVSVSKTYNQLPIDWGSING